MWQAFRQHIRGPRPSPVRPNRSNHRSALSMRERLGITTPHCILYILYTLHVILYTRLHGPFPLCGRLLSLRANLGTTCRSYFFSETFGNLSADTSAFLFFLFFIDLLLSLSLARARVRSLSRSLPLSLSLLLPPALSRALSAFVFWSCYGTRPRGFTKLNQESTN